MEYNLPPRFVIAGQLSRDYHLLPGVPPLVDIPGGSLLYAAAGLSVWEQGIGLLARVGSDYPDEWLNEIARHGLDIRGIHVLPEPADLRRFIAYDESGETLNDNPVGAFARLGTPFPKDLLDYNTAPASLDSRTRMTALSTRAIDIPSDYLDAAAAHLCAMEYLAHSLVPATLRQGHITTITLEPSDGYMNPVYWDDVSAILSGVTAFITSEDTICSLFQGRSTDLWEMAEALSGFGCELIVIKRGPAGQILYDGSSHSRWIIPAYPGHIVDPTGAGDAFCGGFLAGWRQSYNPILAALQGGVSASLVMESANIFYATDCMPGLAQARLESMRDRVRKV